MVEIDDSGINVKFKTDGKMISDAKLLWTPDKYIKSMEDVGIALASSGFHFVKGNQQRLGKEMFMYNYGTHHSYFRCVVHQYLTQENRKHVVTFLLPNLCAKSIFSTNILTNYHVF